MTVSKEFEAAVRAARHPKTLEAAGTGYAVYDVSGVPGAERLPRALVVLLENCVRRAATDEEAVELVSRVVEAGLAGEQGREIQFMPSRVLFQDFTGVPVFVDFAAMRDAMVERGGDPSKVSPRIPCTLVVDHSVIADVTGTEDAALQNQRKEAQRNRERFAFLKWAANSFDNVRIVPPGEGICHQLNMERFSQVVGTDALAAGEKPVACFDTLVEVTGDGVQTLTATQRACVANMTPEYGATTTLFPVDERSVEYLRLTGRSDAQIELIRSYLGMQGVFGETSGRTYAREVTLDLATVEPSLAGPSRPHDRVTPAGLPERFSKGLAAHGVKDPAARFDVALGEKSVSLGHGAIAIAAITSCTTATDPAMMVGAGILAKKAVERGLTPKPWVKKVLAPGSRVTSLLLERAGLTGALRKLGFYTCGFGCMSCIGNSGDIPESLKELSSSMELTSVLSGNRNFEGRISPYVSQNYLMQPALVVAYSLVGTVDVDLAHQAVGVGADGSEVMLRDIMPTNEEIAAVLDEVLTPELFREGSRGLFEGSSVWRDIDAGSSDTFAWDEDSTYVRRAPYFDDAEHRDVVEVRGARALALLGDFVTTDHISPAGAIAPDSPAARYLREHGVRPEDFNTYGSRRGNHEVMMRGTFANVKLSNALADGRKGGWTRDFIDGEVKSIFDASVDYAEHGVPLVVVAGKLYGSGSSRDWAGKGPALLGVRAVIAQSFERIHRSNLVQMGVLPLQLKEGESAETLGLDGTETYDVSPVDVSDGLPAERTATVTATRRDGTKIVFECVVRVDTPMEGDYLSSGGILPYVLDELAE